MRIIEYSLCTLLCLVCIICAYTDMRYGKIKNIVTLPAICLAFVINTLYQWSDGMLVVYLLNLAIITALSMALYFVRFWSAGDSKLLIFIICSLPVRVYIDTLKGNFSSFALIMMIFTFTFIYILADSIILWAKKTDYHKPPALSMKEHVKSFLISYLRGFSCITIFNTLFFSLLNDMYTQNQYLFIVLNFFMVLYLSRIKKLNQLKYVLSMTSVSAAVIIFTDYKHRLLQTDHKILLILLLLILTKNFMNRYNYKKISSNDLEQGMIVARFSLLSLIGNGEKLLENYDESASSRLTEEECIYIRKASEEKHIESLYILRCIPFGVIISLSAIVFTILGEIYVH